MIKSNNLSHLYEKRISPKLKYYEEIIYNDINFTTNYENINNGSKELNNYINEIQVNKNQKFNYKKYNLFIKSDINESLDFHKKIDSFYIDNFQMNHRESKKIGLNIIESDVNRLINSSFNKHIYFLFLNKKKRYITNNKYHDLSSDNQNQIFGKVYGDILEENYTNNKLDTSINNKKKLVSKINFIKDIHFSKRKIQSGKNEWNKAEIEDNKFNFYNMYQLNAKDYYSFDKIFNNELVENIMLYLDNKPGEKDNNEYIKYILYSKYHNNTLGSAVFSSVSYSNYLLHYINNLNKYMSNSLYKYIKDSFHLEWGIQNTYIKKHLLLNNKKYIDVIHSNIENLQFNTLINEENTISFTRNKIKSINNLRNTDNLNFSNKNNKSILNSINKSLIRKNDIILKNWNANNLSIYSKKTIVNQYINKNKNDRFSDILKKIKNTSIKSTFNKKEVSRLELKKIFLNNNKDYRIIEEGNRYISVENSLNRLQNYNEYKNEHIENLLSIYDVLKSEKIESSERNIYEKEISNHEVQQYINHIDNMKILNKSIKLEEIKLIKKINHKRFDLKHNYFADIAYGSNDKKYINKFSSFFEENDNYKTAMMFNFNNHYRKSIESILKIKKYIKKLNTIYVNYEDDSINKNYSVLNKLPDNYENNVVDWQNYDIYIKQTPTYEYKPYNIAYENSLISIKNNLFNRWVSYENYILDKMKSRYHAKDKMSKMTSSYYIKENNELEIIKKDIIEKEKLNENMANYTSVNQNRSNYLNEENKEVYKERNYINYRLYNYEKVNGYEVKSHNYNSEFNNIFRKYRNDLNLTKIKLERYNLNNKDIQTMIYNSVNKSIYSSGLKKYLNIRNENSLKNTFKHSYNTVYDVMTLEEKAGKHEKNKELNKLLHDKKILQITSEKSMKSESLTEKFRVINNEKIDLIERDSNINEAIKYMPIVIKNIISEHNQLEKHNSLIENSKSFFVKEHKNTLIDKVKINEKIYFKEIKDENKIYKQEISMEKMEEFKNAVKKEINYSADNLKNENDKNIEKNRSADEEEKEKIYVKEYEEMKQREDIDDEHIDKVYEKVMKMVEKKLEIEKRRRGM